ncbi:MAG: hypothetical protein J0J01_17805 [Reyranella sp.]|uniref:hypothetical protein n=1 Tax=Reyranella sp. TaxID=1929291 RepID=UPI001AC9CF2E|nr:hypothetical protein [Reyranella sp.]MBN9088763.1 hypothetical protein [Reyranella sp.]
MSGMSVKQLAEAYIAEKAMERTQRYLADGRQFASCNDHDLEQIFITEYRGLVLLDDDRRWDAVVDLQCEFELRGLETPLHRVAAEFALFKERLERLQRVGVCDPVAWQEVRTELADLRRRLARPKN